MPPSIPSDITDTLAKMQRQIDALQAQAGQRPALNTIAGGTVSITSGGSLRVLDTDGSLMFLIGKISPNHTDGSEQRGVLMYREDGTLALSIATGGPEAQGIVIRDRAGHTIFAEDVVAGGLALPWLSYPSPGEEDTTRWPKTNVAAWTTIGRSRGITFSPRLKYHATMTTDPGTTGQLRLLVDGTTVATGSVGSALIGTVALPAFTYNAEVEFQLQAQTTSGAGYIYGITRYLYGVQS